jgi:hypothetical protein
MSEELDQSQAEDPQGPIPEGNRQKPDEYAIQNRAGERVLRSALGQEGYMKYSVTLGLR